MSRRVRRGPIYKKRGRPSTKKQLRGLAILFGLAAIGSISGGVEIATTRSQTKIGASESTIPFAWIALTVICVVLLIVVCALYRKRFLDRAERLNLLINSYREAYQVARTTTDVTAYMDAMKNLRNWERLIAEREKELPNWALKEIKLLPEEQKKTQRNYQWWLRDVIDRAKANAIKDCKGTYKNSNQDKERIYWEFINNVYAGNATFDAETVDAANAAATAVYRATGSFFTPRAPFTLVNSNRSSEKNQSIEALLLNVDAMSGAAFERFCAELLRKNGFGKVKLTQASGDQGVDILAEKGGVQYAIQCKCYASDLGNTPVQEVNAGRAIYGCHVGAVLTNRHFTRGAKEAAAQTHVLLWDRDILIDLIRNAKQ